ncbi:hypothetical protein PPL_10667 [Heterostelium album PN500]|uniref:Carbohydrate binding domain-containing protein n=1 Tax=Heterostelium pallidum (strain ATCC 26659 / Pp 5 / PN500) TaxID=670386 RepID=D3BRQ6_HETP5|nr:hypothetical protein PPL_10667 [Heterostelium album PN500]EFA76088.1 hypothetical protein PPL_10667 [Heterostelium album PN500]|eukprot:XP_020428222.1 hypothetical protein PPL_10667 [Heterostelium album PN500]
MDVSLDVELVLLLTQKIVKQWTDDNGSKPYTQVEVTIRNNGPRSVNQVVIGAADGTLNIRDATSIWNIAVVGADFTLPSYASTLGAGQTFTFGYINKGNQPANITCGILPGSVYVYVNESANPTIFIQNFGQDAACQIPVTSPTPYTFCNSLFCSKIEYRIFLEDLNIYKQKPAATTTTTTTEIPSNTANISDNKNNTGVDSNKNSNKNKQKSSYLEELKDTEIEEMQESIACPGQDFDSMPVHLFKNNPNVTQLDLSYNNIKKVESIDNLTRLQSLVLDNNQIGSENSFPHLPTLKTLSLNNNNIDDLKLFIESIKDKFPNLTHLSLLKNPACPSYYFTGTDFGDYQKYRYYVLSNLKNLKFLDFNEATQDEKKEALRLGAFAFAARPTQQDIPKEEEEEESFRALPQELTEEGQGKSGFTVSNYLRNSQHGNEEFVSENTP